MLFANVWHFWIAVPLTLGAVLFGVATIQPSTHDTPLKLLQAADTGLYAAKRAGRNQIKLACR